MVNLPKEVDSECFDHDSPSPFVLRENGRKDRVLAPLPAHVREKMSFQEARTAARTGVSMRGGTFAR